jgi:hypothetical protein
MPKLNNDPIIQARYYSEFTRPAKDFGYDDEKRLQARFSDRALKLRWNIKNKQCEIWYEEDYRLPYCILTIPDRYNFPKALKEMEQRERSNKEILDEYLAHQESAEREELRQIKDRTRPYAEALYSKQVGRVSITV